MPFWDMYYHIVWGTYKRQHLITPNIEAKLFGLIRHKSQELQCPIHAINTMPDHIHVVTSIKPSLSVAKWVKDVKGFSSYQINQLDMIDDHFRWQSSYGSITYGRKAISNVIDYLNHQKQHHANDETYIYLERTDIAE